MIFGLLAFALLAGVALKFGHDTLRGKPLTTKQAETYIGICLVAVAFICLVVLEAFLTMRDDCSREPLSLTCKTEVLP